MRHDGDDVRRQWLTDWTAIDPRRCAIQPCQAEASEIFGARPACAKCAEESRAFIERVKQREGNAAALAVTL